MGCEKGRKEADGDDGERWLSETEKPGRIGEGGAYISASWESVVGEVSAENSWRTLSHCVCVVWREDCRATLSEDNGACELVGP